MNQRRADLAVGTLLATILLVGTVLGWQTYQQNRALEGMTGMMGSSMGTVHGTNPLWYLFGALTVSAVVVGFYLSIREEFRPVKASERERHGVTSTSSDATASSGPGSDSAESTRPEGSGAHILDLLPDDERRVLEPVLTSPGITQIELRDRSDFSKSKVSQTVSSLEKRGLLYRERQGRTFRVYPSDKLHQE